MKRILILLAAFLVSCGGSSDVSIPAPVSLRTDLYYGYYGGGQDALNTLGETNLIWEAGLFGIDEQIRVISEAKQPAIMDVNGQLFTYCGTGQSHNRCLSPTAEQDLRNAWTAMHERGSLANLIGACPIDEPNLNLASPDDLVSAVSIIRKVAAEFQEIANIKVVAIYAIENGGLIHSDLFDWIGMDDYPRLSEFLVNGEYQSLVNALKPGQRTMLIPGGSFGQDITPFLNFAQTHSEVAAVIPFIHFSTAGIVGIGAIQTMANSYCVAGQQIKNPGAANTCAPNIVQ